LTTEHRHHSVLELTPNSYFLIHNPHNSIILVFHLSLVSPVHVTHSSMWQLYYSNYLNLNKSATHFYIHESMYSIKLNISRNCGLILLTCDNTSVLSVT